MKYLVALSFNPTVCPENDNSKIVNRVLVTLHYADQVALMPDQEGLPLRMEAKPDNLEVWCDLDGLRLIRDAASNAIRRTGEFLDGLAMSALPFAKPPSDEQIQTAIRESAGQILTP